MSPQQLRERRRKEARVDTTTAESDGPRKPFQVGEMPCLLRRALTRSLVKSISRIRSNAYPLVFVILIGCLFLFVNKVITFASLFIIKADFCSKYPELAKQLIEPWYEFEDTALELSQSEGYHVSISTDVPRRDAIVNAFKVITCSECPNIFVTSLNQHAWSAYGELYQSSQ